MPFFDFFSYLSSINAAFRSFVLGSIFSAYALFLYYFQDEINLDLLDLSYLFVIPFAASCVMLLIIPKKYDSVLPKTSQNKSEQNNSNISIKNNVDQELSKNHLSQQVLESSSRQEPKTEKTSNQETKKILENQTSDSKLRENFKMLKETVSGYEKKISDFEKQIHEMKVTIQDLKRTGVIKNDTYESALTELKAFKSELDNPFNFINKYFEMLDIPGMYNPKSSIKSNGIQSAYDEYDLQKKLDMIPKKEFEHQDSKHSTKPDTKYNNKKRNPDLLSEKNNDNKNQTEKHKHLKSNKNKSSKENKTIFKPRRVDVIG